MTIPQPPPAELAKRLRGAADRLHKLRYPTAARDLREAAETIERQEQRIEALEGALKEAHLPAETSKGYPTVQSEAVRAFCEKFLSGEKDV